MTRKELIDSVLSRIIEMQSRNMYKYDKMYLMRLNMTALNRIHDEIELEYKEWSNKNEKRHVDC